MTTWTAATEQTEAWVAELSSTGGAFAAGHFDADAFDVAQIWDPWVAAGEDIEAWSAIAAEASNCPGRDGETSAATTVFSRTVFSLESYLGSEIFST